MEAASGKFIAAGSSPVVALVFQREAPSPHGIPHRLCGAWTCIPMSSMSLELSVVARSLYMCNHAHVPTSRSLSHSGHRLRHGDKERSGLFQIWRMERMPSFVFSRHDFTSAVMRRLVRTRAFGLVSLTSKRATLATSSQTEPGTGRPLSLVFQRQCYLAGACLDLSHCIGGCGRDGETSCPRSMDRAHGDPSMPLGSALKCLSCPACALSFPIHPIFLRFT